jgi:acyl-CoA thioesterase
MNEYEDLAPNFKRALFEKIGKKQPYWTLLGIELLDVKKGWAKLKLPFSETLIHPLGIAHGGAIFSLADSAVAMALLGLTEKEEWFTTIETNINYIRSFRGGEIIAEARIVNRGQKTALGDVDITDQQGRLVAKSRATYMILKQGEL